MPHSTRVTARACGNRPPVGVANLARIASVAARSNTVPSVAVTTRPNTSDPAAATRPAASAAVRVNNSRSTATGNRSLACDNATVQTGTHITTTGLKTDSNGHRRVITAAEPCPQNRHNPSTNTAVTAPDNLARCLSTCPAADNAAATCSGVTTARIATPPPAAATRAPGPARIASRNDPDDPPGRDNPSSGTPMADFDNETPGNRRVS